MEKNQENVSVKILNIHYVYWCCEECKCKCKNPYYTEDIDGGFLFSGWQQKECSCLCGKDRGM